ncbi:cupin domain-containing protein [Lysobacter panacisoli]|uniref:Cupin domain-containing protein n=1 Tax=Lysobacter panacisoli TaxID=1255263 RepID=A0ABP9L752_9GAMM|nr:cupin domain-containing protein [Lysobacter panacisoli]
MSDARNADDAVNLRDKLALFSQCWSPRVVARMNDVEFKLVKMHGDFVWHSHADTDEVFLVVKGEMEIGFRDRDVVLREGEMFVIPRGVEHITRAREECHALIIEPRDVVNTGEAGGELTARNDVWV